MVGKIANKYKKVTITNNAKYKKLIVKKIDIFNRNKNGNNKNNNCSSSRTVKWRPSGKSGDFLSVLLYNKSWVLVA